jgi:hypothetical protein
MNGPQRFRLGGFAPPLPVVRPTPERLTTSLSEARRHERHSRARRPSLPPRYRRNIMLNAGLRVEVIIRDIEVSPS